jgi:hypothetical protein
LGPSESQIPYLYTSINRTMQMKTYSLTIPKPCHQGWDDMIPNDEGRHCLACAKTVIDFSVMTDAAVQQYFLNGGGQPVCGRFKNTQLERIRIHVPGYFFQKRTAIWKKFLVIFLICFGSNFFSIDILLGDSKALYAQTVSKRSGNKKANKLRIKKINKPRWRYEPELFEPKNVMYEISGFVVAEKYLPPLPMFPPEDYAPNVEELQQPVKSDSATNISAGKNSTSGGGEQPQKEQAPPQTAEFILPAILAPRRRNRKKAR